MPIGPMENTFGQAVINDSLELINKLGYNRIYCSLTGIAYANIDESEIIDSLKIELRRKPLSDMAALVESFYLRYLAASSAPCPSLRVHKDHNTLLRMLKTSENGAAKLLVYMANRLLFESLVPIKEINSTVNRRKRLSFMRILHDRIAAMPVKWNQSLDAVDELSEAANKAVNILHVVGGMATTPAEEGKAAQRCLEVLLRLDAIHNLRHSFYNAKLRADLIAFRESHEPTFFEFAKLLDAIEQDGIVRLMKAKQPPIGNAMAITAALESLNWTRKRHGTSREQYLESIEQGLNKVGTGTLASSHIIAIKELVSKPSLSKKDKVDLKSALTDLEKNINSVSANDKRLEALESYYKRVNSGKANGSKLKTTAKASLKHVAESYIDKGLPVPKELAAKLKQLKVKPTREKTLAEMGERARKSALRRGRIDSIKSLFKSKSDAAMPDMSGFKKKEN